STGPEFVPNTSDWVVGGADTSGKGFISLKKSNSLLGFS
ncbi:unnamed protein product, partial [marine sediment metagenome]